MSLSAERPRGDGAVGIADRRDRRRRHAGVRRHHRLRLARQHRHPARAHRRDAARADPLARRRHGRAGRARGRAGDAAAARPQPGDGALRGAARNSSICNWRCSATASRRSCASTARSAPAATWRRSPTARWRWSARARCGTPRARRSRQPAALAAAGLEPLALRAKEGLALINGTDGMLGMLCLAVHDLTALFALADVVAAMSVEALLGTDRAFAADLQALRPQVGQAISARNLTRLLAGSEIVASHRYGDSRVQDAYSLRCTPQVHGAARDTLAHARDHRRARARRRDRQPDDPARRPGRELRQLPRRAAGAGVRLPGDRDQRAGGDRRAPHRPAARRRPLARAAAVPHHRRRRQQRAR